MEGKEPTIEDLLNQIEFMKNALLFYSEEENYSNGNGTLMANEKTRIDLDKGHQARFALKQIESLDNYNKKMLDNAIKSAEDFTNKHGEKIDDALEAVDELNELMKTVNKLKNDIL
jgi:hypothetical protein